MPLDATEKTKATLIEALNAGFADQPAETLLAHSLQNPALGSLALVSSFGVESIVLLHMVSRIRRDLPVLFVDTELLFAETLQYQRRVAALLGLGDMRILRAHRDAVFAADPDGLLQHFDPDSCCDLRKVQPLKRGLGGFDGWISGRKRFQSGARVDLPLFEADRAQRIKINPLARWRPSDLAAYMRRHRLPPHPLADKGFTSLGCRPCTTPTKPGENARAGRWRGQEKTECGLHFPARPENRKARE